MMRHKVVLYPLYQETLVVYGTTFDTVTNGTDYTKHLTLKTTRAEVWQLSHLLRELADRIEYEEP